MLCPIQEIDVSCKECRSNCPLNCDYSDNCIALYNGHCGNMKRCKLNKFISFVCGDYLKEYLWLMGHRIKGRKLIRF